MTSRDFVYWLQGYFEISGETVLSPNATQIVKNHLNMVFKHEIDPSFGDKKHQKELSQVHEHRDRAIQELAKTMKDTALLQNC